VPSCPHFPLEFPSGKKRIPYSCSEPYEAAAHDPDAVETKSPPALGRPCSSSRGGLEREGNLAGESNAPGILARVVDDGEIPYPLGRRSRWRSLSRRGVADARDPLATGESPTPEIPPRWRTRRGTNQRRMTPSILSPSPGLPHVFYQTSSAECSSPGTQAGTEDTPARITEEDDTEYLVSFPIHPNYMSFSMLL